MRFATLVVPFLLVGCGPYNPSKDSGSTSSGKDCVDPGFEPARSPSMTITQMVYNATTLLSVFDPNADYDEWGPSGCYNEDTGEFQWVFESGGEPVGALRAKGDTEGGQGLDGALGRFAFYMYDDDTILHTFQNQDFVDGTYTINTLVPFQATIIGNANDNGNTLMVNVTAQATAP